MRAQNNNTAFYWPHFTATVKTSKSNLYINADAGLPVVAFAVANRPAEDSDWHTCC